jgi:hypothetical protein
MKKPGKQQLALAISCLVCVVVALRNTNGLEGTEFSGGWLTGTLLSMVDIGTLLFVLALIVSFMHLRIAGAIALISSLLCLPLYLYLVAPVPFNQIFGFGHEFKVQPCGGLQSAWRAIVGVLTLAITAFLCIRCFALANSVQIPE